MSEISELERRITAALDRIARDVDVLAARPAVAESTEESHSEQGADQDPSDVVENAAEAAATAEELAGLKQQLEDEKLANQQLEERLKSLRLKLDKKDAEAELAMSDLISSMAELDGALQALRQSSAELRGSSEALRQGAAAGVSDPEAINAAMAAELAALQAERQAEAAEGGAILTAMEPLLTRAEEKEQA